MIIKNNNLSKWLKQNTQEFHPVIQFNPAKERLIHFDFSDNNESFKKINTAETNSFCIYINKLLRDAHAKFGIGGYDELRPFYSRSSLFNDTSIEQDEPRRLHLGVDIWGKAGTEIYAPMEGKVHSFAFNNNFGDYGATIILEHRLESKSFFTLYGHLGLADLQNLKEGDLIKRGQQFAHFGKPEENGHWPPHLHFQVINDIGNYKGDYPGVCKFSERDIYLNNCPDPELILKMQE